MPYVVSSGGASVTAPNRVEIMRVFFLFFFFFFSFFLCIILFYFFFFFSELRTVLRRV